ncbi:MAG TPA: flavodoxin-dependent (E)-4-hydroxy-3-methylbut-2-enyl-diphosphate synthase [Spirochaetota bacterium]|nr:flavodoxin-dependent (E)-4-hydroxy-3-methylbut-2-enyl-diphosphate synthase [Spirochaetota bacterium]HPC40573.1 flavodoxin-dependent (E)-4-hydroxy-3-methylbut-2-enyl-diphosphate synthase [Spirochaetota bacterium]HQF07919.1 flavodoxin-dependent (E)-4-hydroxy-3-methylbut-2-enyl-diphosphate synthase [Spirochaetota bacterium]HQH96479.1 flavodoxin-dependent (E)-4-hydroxy-3-methylbut-2-enyl-diphosphate synthase [Spirochaetota bacterium]HQJ69651.1 flavodoxin-dependent (E)-4-hydroxy-3-methylbut-2-eny
MTRQRRKTRQVRAGSLAIGGGAPVSIQTMATVPIERTDDAIAQVRALASAGAELVRVALRSAEAAELLRKLIPAVQVPVCADIHFDHRIALAAIRAGVHKVRINPGNIGDPKGVREVVAAARDRGVPIRIGVNSGSVDRRRFPEVTPKSLVASAMEHVVILEENGFADIVVSIKASDIARTVAANELFASQRDYPLHVGLTEAGYGMTCIVQSSVAIGHLLMEGIGDTIRVSMTGDPAEEIIVARKILESAGEREAWVRIVACPTCGRTDPSLDILVLAKEVDAAVTARFEKTMRERGRTLHVAVMGCEVNGPGEAKDADAGLAGIRDGRLLLFAKGAKIRTVEYRDAVAALMEEIERII